MNVVQVPQGMALVPLTPVLYERYEGSNGTYPGFDLLSEPVYRLGMKLSQRGAVAYVEAEFFGNSGGQDAIVWHHGAVVMQPLHSFDGQAPPPGVAPAASNSRRYPLLSDQ